MVGEQPYKSRDMVVSDSGLGRLLVSTKHCIFKFVTTNIFNCYGAIAFIDFLQKCQLKCVSIKLL